MSLPVNAWTCISPIKGRVELMGIRCESSRLWVGETT